MTETRSTNRSPAPSRFLARGLLVAAIATVPTLLLVDDAEAQSRVRAERLDTRVGSTGTGQYAPPGYNAGRGRALGDGNALGGQTFSWLRGPGAGQRMGAGNLMDANTQLGSGGANAGGTPQDWNARNLVVTNNVPGGRGFRGDVGYTAASDFRGELGGDDSYAFRQDSAFSSPTFLASEVANDRFLVAQGLGAFEFRRDFTPADSGMNASVDQPSARMRLDRMSGSMAMGRSNWSLGDDRVIGSSKNAAGEDIRYIVSPLRGLQSEVLTDPIARANMSLYEQARARDEVTRGLVTPEEVERRRREERGMLDLRVEGDALTERSRVLPESYLDILDGIARKPDGSLDEERLDEVREGLDGLRDGLETERPDGMETGEPAPGDEGTAPGDDATGAGGDGEITAPQGARAEREAEREKIRGRTLSVEEISEVLRHGGRISRLGAEDKRRVDELIGQGEQALRDGDYFRAERRFLQAQDLTRVNPLIEVGIAHSQLGAGLYLSASLTLRNLFLENPELIDAVYDPALLPPPARLDRVVAMIRNRIDLGEDRSGYGLLLAYIGHQTADRAMIEEGLALVGGTPSLDASRELLQGVWLGER